MIIPLTLSSCVKSLMMLSSWEQPPLRSIGNYCEIFDDLGLFAMDEETIKHFFSIRQQCRTSCVIGCGYKVARSLIGDPSFSWRVIYKEFVLKHVDETVDNTSLFFTNIYSLVGDIPTSGSTIGWNARLAQLMVGMIVHLAHRHKPQDRKLVYNGNNSKILELAVDTLRFEHNNIHKDFYILIYLHRVLQQFMFT